MTTPRSSLSSQLGSRLLAGVGTLTLLAAIGLFASRPARTAGGPVPVTVANVPLAVNATAAESQPVEVYTLATALNPSYSNLVYTVPAGKQLVVDSMTLEGGGGNNVSDTGLVFDEDSAGNALSFASLSTGSVTADIAATTQPMHLHVPPGGKVVVDVYKRPANSVGAAISLSGHLVDAP